MRNGYAVQSLQESRWKQCTKGVAGWRSRVWLRMANLRPLPTDEDVEISEQEVLEQSWAQGSDLSMKVNKVEEEVEGTSRRQDGEGKEEAEGVDPDLLRLFREMDVDKNGTLSIDEFVSGMSRLNLVCTFTLLHV